MSNSSESQRKFPKQNRSKVIVDSIIDATVRILPKVGSQNITTKKIADIAGISVGSLYQYFPNKESVLLTIMDMFIKTEMEKFNAKINSVSEKTMQETTDAMVDLALDAFLSERDKIREIFKKAPELGKLPSILEHRRIVVAKLAIEMEKFHPGQSKMHYSRVSFVAVNSVMGIIHVMLYDETQNHSKEDLASEIKLLLNSYFYEKMKL